MNENKTANAKYILLIVDNESLKNEYVKTQTKRILLRIKLFMKNVLY